MHEAPNSLIDLIAGEFSFDELQELCLKLGVDFDSLPGENRKAKARELIAYIQRQGSTSQLVEQIQDMKPGIDEDAFEETLKIKSPRSELAKLEIELATLRQLLLKIQDNSPNSIDIEHFQELLRTANRAMSRSEELAQPRWVHPSGNESQIRLIPEHLVFRLEESHSDENVTSMVLGVFIGAALSILVNWATAQPFAPTAISIAFLVLFVLLATGCAFLVHRFRERTKLIGRRISTYSPHLTDPGSFSETRQG